MVGIGSLSPKKIFFLSSTRRRIIRLLRYSTYGWDMLPISQNNFFVLETTIGRLLRWDKFPISNEDLVIQELTIHRLLRTRREYSTTTVLEQSVHLLQRNYSSSRRQANRLLRYSKKQLNTANDKFHQKATSRSHYYKILFCEALKKASEAGTLKNRLG